MLARAWLMFLMWLTAVDSLVAQDRLTPDLLKKVKGATVLVTAGSGATQRSGSGFLVHCKDSVGYVATNAHVLMDEGKFRPTDVKCILHGGTENEAKLDGTVITYDFPQDLALIKVKHDKLPEPLSVTAPAEVFETQTVFTVGFPFGELLGAQDLGVNHTISRTSVSSIRTNQQREVEFIQLDGGLNPGNSGGPIVDGSGRLVGMAIAKVRGSEIGFAIPTARVATLLQGHATIRTVTLGEFDVKGQDVEIAVELVDPLGAIKEVRGYAFQSSEIEKQNPQVAAKSERPQLPSRLAGQGIVPVRFTKSEDGLVNGTVSITLSKEPANYLQVSTLTADGKERFYSPRRIDPSLKTKPKGWSESEPSREWRAVSFAAQPAMERTLQLPGKVTDVTPAGGGQFVILSHAELQKASILNLAKGELSLEIELPSGAHIAGGRVEILVGPAAGKLLVWSLPDLKRQPDRIWNRAGEIICLKQGWNATGPLIVCDSIHARWKKS